MNEQLIGRLERLGEAWKSQFENPPTLPMSWSIDASTGVLMLNGVGVCSAAAIIQGETYDVEQLTLPLQDGSVEILIDWPFGGAARIAEIVTHKEVPAA